MGDEFIIEGAPGDAGGDGGSPTRTSQAAIWSLVCAFIPLGQLLSIILAIVALSKISGSGGRLGGKGLAIAGLVISLACPVLLVPMVAVVAAIAIPGLMRSKIGTNETSAIGSLRSLTTAQEQFRLGVLCDQDGDGMGEYGWLGELAGIESMRVSNNKVSTSPYIAQILGVKNAGGVAQKSGYCFRMYLPTTTVAAGEVTPVDTAGVSADADAQEVRWACYAWPVARGQSGVRAFVATQAGVVYGTGGDVTAYSGMGGGPAPEAAFDTRGRSPRNLDAGIGVAAAGLQAGDGNIWVPAGN